MRKVQRRSFLKTAAGISGITILRPDTVFASKANSAIQLGVIGCGNRGTAVISSMSRNTNTNITAMADLFGDKLLKARGKLNQLNSTKDFPDIPKSNNQDEKIVLKHSLPGATVRYSLNETDLDSIGSPVYKDPLSVGNYGKIKTKAYKDGWLSSEVEEFVFFRKGFRPDTVLLLTEPDEKFQGEGGVTLINENKGLPDFYRHPAWIAFRENDLVANFIFEENVPTIRNITLSFVRNYSTISMPPEEMQVWGGNDPDNLQLIKKVNPPQASETKKTGIEGISMDLPAANFKYYKLVAKPVKKLEGGNPKKRNIWLMVDEVFFN